MTFHEMLKELDYHDNIVVHSEQYANLYDSHIKLLRGKEFRKNVSIVVVEKPGQIEKLKLLKFRVLADDETLNAWSGFMVAEFCAIRDRKNTRVRARA